MENLAEKKEDNFKYKLKICVLGSSGVGKTSLLSRYVDNTFSSNFLNTIGVDMRVFDVSYGDYRIKVQLWDTSGQEKYQSLCANYTRGAHGYIYVFDLGDRSSFDKLVDFVLETERVTGECQHNLLLGNKVDSAKSKVNEKEIVDFARYYKMIYYETSAKTDVNVKSSIEFFIRSIASSFEKGDIEYKENDYRGKRLEATIVEKNDKCNC